MLDRGTHRFLLGAVGLPVHVLPLPEFVRRWLKRSTFLLCMGRDASSGTTRFDGMGVTTDIGRSFDRALYAEMEGTVARVASYYDPKRLLVPFLAGGDREALFTVHPLGGCSIGRSADDGVADHRGEVFGYSGLFVADGSLYPRSPGIAPSMTIAALAERQASLMQ